jgi:hypothetical protein
MYTTRHQCQKRDLKEITLFISFIFIRSKYIPLYYDSLRTGRSGDRTRTLPHRPLSPSKPHFQLITSYLQGYSGQGVALTIHRHPQKKQSYKNLLTLWAFMACYGVQFTFTLLFAILVDHIFVVILFDHIFLLHNWIIY